MVYFGWTNLGSGIAGFCRVFIYCLFDAGFLQFVLAGFFSGGLLLFWLLQN
jgi:hypothetical protein